MNREDKVYVAVSKLYQNSSREMGVWMWNNHVKWVANRTKELAEKYGANTEKAYCAALLHDLADYKYDRNDDEFDECSEIEGRVILKESGFEDGELHEVMDVIIKPHSCRPGNLPTTIEGKVLATADAMFHLETSFFPMLCFKHKPSQHETYEAWQVWFDEKIERDFGPKIFFEEERNMVEADYQALKRVFGNRTLKS